MGRTLDFDKARREKRKADGAIQDGRYLCYRAGDARLDWNTLRGHNGYLEVGEGDDGEQQLIFIPDDNELPVIVIGARPPRDS